MKQLITLAMIVSVGFAGYASYESDHYNDDFFKDATTWHLQKKSSQMTDELPSPVTVKVEGDVNISGKYEIMPGVFVEETVSCKQLSITEEGKEPRYVGVFEMLNKIYAYSEKLGRFEIVADYSVSEGRNASISGSEWTADRVDYIEEADLLHLRTILSHDGNSLTQVYGIGSDKFIADSEIWENPGYLEFVSCELTDGTEVTADVFALPTFQPTNEYYSIGKEWIIENYNIYDENEHSYSTKRVTADIEFAHMPCRRVSLISPDTDTERSYYIGCDYNGYVYKYDNECQRLRLALNFNLEVGDLAIANDEMSEVTLIDTVEVNGKEFKRFKFKGADNDSDFWRYWVDGVGASDGNILFDEPRPIGMLEKMDKCLINGECIFTYEDFSKQSGVETIGSVANSQQSGQMFDLSGRRINKASKGEIFITNGHKHIGL